MKLLSRILLVLLSIATGGLFLYSALSKMFPVRSFEYTIMDSLALPAMVAVPLARTIIALEGALGMLIATHFWGKKKWPLKAAMALTAAFTVYLVILWVLKGDNVNCGCFGDAIWMRPSVSILKNILIMGALWLLLKFHSGFVQEKKWLLPAAFSLSFIAIGVSSLLLFPVMRPYKIDLSELYTSDKRFVPNIDLTKGKHIIAFLSPTCSHCIKAAGIMHRIKEKNNAIPFFMIIGGTESDLTDFWQKTGATNIPYTRLDAGPIIKITGGSFPQIYMVIDGMVTERLDYPYMDEVSLARWSGTSVQSH